MGAAINDKATSKNELFGNAIAHTVNHFYNLYDPEENMLKIAYRNAEGQNALGLLGLNATQPRLSSNYTDYNVRFEVPPYSNANGTAQPDCLDNKVYGWETIIAHIWVSDNQSLCDNMLRDDGAINVVLRIGGRHLHLKPNRYFRPWFWQLGKPQLSINFRFKCQYNQPTRP